MSYPYTINFSPSSTLNIYLGISPARKCCQLSSYDILSFVSWGSKSLFLRVYNPVMLLFIIHFMFLFGWFQAWNYVFKEISLLVIQQSRTRGVCDPIVELWDVVAVRVTSISSKNFSPPCFNLDIQWVQMTVMCHTIFFSLLSLPNLGLKLPFFLVLICSATNGTNLIVIFIYFAEGGCTS